MHRPPRRWRLAAESGFTLIEILVVIVLIALLLSFTVNRVDTVLSWKRKAEIRKFTNTWQFLYNEALARGEKYRLLIDIDTGSYYAQRELPVSASSVQDVDYLKNFRSPEEKKRRAERNQNREEEIKRQYEAELALQSGSLDTQFFDVVYNDPDADGDLGTPVEFPSLADPVYFSDDVRIRDIKLAGTTENGGTVSIRFSPRGASDFAVVHLLNGDQIFTAFMNPSTGEISLIPDDVDFDWLIHGK